MPLIWSHLILFWQYLWINILFVSLTPCYCACGKQVDELLKQRDSIHCSFTVTKTANNSIISGSGSNMSNGSSSKIPNDDLKVESPGEDVSSEGKDKSSKKKWFNLNLKGSDKKSGWQGVLWWICIIWMVLVFHSYTEMRWPPACCFKAPLVYLVSFVSSSRGFPSLFSVACYSTVPTRHHKILRYVYLYSYSHLHTHRFGPHLRS